MTTGWSGLELVQVDIEERVDFQTVRADMN
jgi:hypothetical protein